MTKKMWGGRFKKKTDPLVEEFTKSIDYDYKLAKYDVLGSIMHVLILKKSSLITNKEAEKLGSALKKIYNRIEKKKFAIDRKAEDIHTNIQNAIEKELGSLALKLHTARSRNDQVLFDLKLFCAAELNNIQGLSLALMESLKTVCKKAKGIIIPGYTHLQHAQLVYLSDYLGSFIEMLERDNKRLENIKNSMKLTLGAGALAGTPIDAKLYKKEAKGIKIEPTTNPIDTVSDRDFVIEILSMLSILGMHLSRLAEDLIIWSTKEFNFVELDDAFATGSSLMPQKKNPDVLELIRGYTGTLNGNLISVLTMMKGLSLGYNRDMQLDKPPLFSSFEIIAQELQILAKLVERLAWNRRVIKKRIEEDEALYATDLVYYLIKKGVPFKRAHDIIGKLVKFSLDKGRKIKGMKDTELAKFSNKFKHSEIARLLDPLVSVKSRISIKR
ncbi:MAG: argininosuccinate lyase [Candidatus Omnitrophica bacterium]|nr:argininosuccinate lyase [Candidatus Omnitrophota bacterium]